MHKHRYLLLAVATFTFITSTLPVMADHQERATNNVEDTHHWKVAEKEKNPCASEKVIKK